MVDFNYEVLINEGKKYVKYADGNQYIVQKDENGIEYFHVPNFLAKGKLPTFSGKVKDAIEVIRQGDGDALLIRNLFGKHESVIRFLDREHGEKIRGQVIEGFKNADFGYSLKFTYLNSFSGGQFIKADNNFIGLDDAPTSFIFFHSEEDALTHKISCLKEAQEIAVAYNKVFLTKNEQEIQAFITKHHIDDVISHIWSSIAEDVNFKFEIVQVLKEVEKEEV